MLQVSELEDRVEEITDSEQERKRKRKEMTILRDLWDNIKHTNIHIIGCQKREERD